MKDNFWKIFAVVAVVSIAGAMVYANNVTNKANEGITFEAHIKGNKDAAVTLTEYSDFQCPACGQFYPVLKDVEKKYGENLKIEYKHFPLLSIHQFALPAAKAAEAAGQQGKFFAMHDKLFENQSVWSHSTNPQAYFVKYAEEIGLDVPLFKKQMKASAIHDKIKSEFDEARTRGLTGTPSFFLNEKKMEFNTLQEFTDQIASAVGATTTEASTQTDKADKKDTEDTSAAFGF